MTDHDRVAVLACLEADYADLRDRFGALVVGRHRGDDVTELEADYRRRHAEVAARLAAAEPPPGDEEAERALASMRSIAAWMTELEPVAEGAEPAEEAEGTEGPAPAGPADGEPTATAALRRATMAAYAEAGAAVRLGSETVDRLTALARIAREPDATTRRETFLALEPVWRAIDGDGGPTSPYRRLLRASAERWARDGSPAEAAAQALGMAPGELEPTLHRILAAWRRATGHADLEPWDHLHAVGAMDRWLARAIPVERLRPITDTHLAALGADPVTLGIRYDIEPRPGRPRIPVAFTLSIDVARRRPDGSWRPATPWIFATYREGGAGDLGELVHEAGHALHYAAIRARPAFFEPPVEGGGLVEGVADLLGWDVHEPAFQEHHLGTSADLRDGRLARYGSVVLDVCWALLEIELHRHPDRAPNDAWSELTGEGLGLVPHPEWSWWAMRGQLVEAPGYMVNYALAAIVAAALRARIREARGDWSAGDPGWYGFVAEGLLRFGAARSPAEVLRDFLGGPLTADALVADLETAG